MCQSEMKTLSEILCSFSFNSPKLFQLSFSSTDPLPPIPPSLAGPRRDLRLPYSLGDPIQLLGCNTYHLYDHDFQFKPPLRIPVSYIQLHTQHFHFNI